MHLETKAESKYLEVACAPMEMLYADDLILIAESEELLTEKVRIWKEGMEAKGLRVTWLKQRY